MSEIIINKEKCIGCGLCAKDCVGSHIKIEAGKAVLLATHCIRCGHCESICPNHAIEISGCEDDVMEFDEQTRLNPEELLMAIKTRRTIRQFTSEKVDRKLIDMIIEAGRLAPTGTNGQATTYILLQDKKADCEKVAVTFFRKLIAVGKKLPVLRGLNLDDNFFFKKAPLVIVILGKDKVSSSLAAQNMAFMAEANGLGVLFSGFFTVCFNMVSRIRKICGYNGKEKAVTTLVIGFPAVKYHRTAHRNPANVIEA